MLEVIQTNDAPRAIGTYSQAVKMGQTVYLSGQIPLVAATGQMVEGDILAQIEQVFKNLTAVCKAANATLQDIVKINVYLTDLNHFPHVNSIMASHIHEPYPARAVVEVSGLPKGAMVEMDAILVIP